MNPDEENEMDNTKIMMSSYLSDEFRYEFGNVDIQKFQKFSTITPARACFIAAYSSLFIVGLVGNFWVACVHGAVWRYTRQTLNNDAPRAIQIYILALCFCDLVVLGFLSLLISDLIYGQWIVPSVFLCRLYLTSESVNKFCSPFLLAAMSGYCYFSISRTTSLARNESRSRSLGNSFRRYSDFMGTQRWSDARIAGLVVSSSIFIVLVLVSPVYIYGDVHYVLFQNGSEIVEIYQKCAFEPPPLLRSAFTVYSFIGGYVIPAASFTLFYSALLYRVRVHSLSMRRRPSTEYFGRVAKTTTGLILFYLICWTPYWTMMLYQFATEEDGPPSMISVVFGLVIHILPYFCTTGYPILYTLLNRNIKEAYRKVTTVRRREREGRKRSEISGVSQL